LPESALVDATVRTDTTLEVVRMVVIPPCKLEVEIIDFDVISLDETLLEILVSKLSAKVLVLTPVFVVVNVSVITAHEGVYVIRDAESVTMAILSNWDAACVPVTLILSAPGVTIVDDGPEILRMPIMFRQSMEVVPA
jgi:hypothetical protein